MTAVYRKCQHPKTPENTRMKANSRGGKDARCLTCLRAYEDSRRGRKRVPNWRAEWPIVDPTLTRDELIAEAEVDLPNVRPKGYRLVRKTYTIDGNRLILTAYSYKVNPPKIDEHLPAEPILKYAETRMDRLDYNQRATLTAARHRGFVTIDAADRLAVALGTHPGLLWAEWWLDMEATA